MAITKTAVTIFASASIVAGGTKSAPATGGTGSHVNTTSYGTSSFVFKITNGSSAPGVAGTITFQNSPDGGVTWFDFYSISGDTVANSVTSGTLTLDRGVMGFRALCYGNTTNPVTFESILEAVAG